MAVGFVLILALWLVTVSLGALVLAIVLRRSIRQRRDRRVQARNARLRPVLFAVTVEDEPDYSELNATSRHDYTPMVDLVWSMLTKVKGSAREGLILWLEAHDELARECRRARSLRRIVRMRAAVRLGAAGREEFAYLVTPMLKDRDEQVRHVAARSLGLMANPETVTHLLDAACARRGVPNGLITMALLHMGPAITQQLTRGLTSTDARARRVCCQLLGMHGTLHAAKYLIEVAKLDRDGSSRRAAIEALGRIGSPNCVGPLVRIAREGDVVDRIVATRALGLIGGQQAHHALVGIAVHETGEVMYEAVRGLSRMGDRGEQTLLAMSVSNLATSDTAREALDRRRLRARHRSRARHGEVLARAGVMDEVRNLSADSLQAVLRAAGVSDHV